MREDVLRQVSELLARELDGVGDDLDSLESGVIEMLRQVGQQTLQRKLAEKKRGTEGAGSSAPADEKPGS